MKNEKMPPGASGISPKWTSSAKSGIGKALNAASDVIFTLGSGIVNEVFYPKEDIVCVRDMELLVTEGSNFFSEEKRDTEHEVKWIKEGVPAFHITNTCKQKKYVITKEIITDPYRDTLLQKINFKPLSNGTDPKFNLYVLLAPHIHNHGMNNNGWVGKYKGVPMMFAESENITLAMACSAEWLKRSVGYVGSSDGYTDLKQHNEMEWEYARADKGNIALTAQIDLTGTESFVIAISFGKTASEAGNRARASIMNGFETAKERYVSEWMDWQASLKKVTSGSDFRISAAVLRLNESKNFPGGIVASLSIPWGQIKGDDDLGGYHLVWPRDLVESSGGFLALNAKEDVLRILNYLISTQEEDGRWSQNMWLQGDPYWKGIQMDQVALPLLLIENCFRNKIIDEERMKRYWPTVQKAVTFLMLNGPSTKQDRWEEESGLTSFTLAAEIAGLLAAANLAEANNEKEMALYCRETADYWNDNIELWNYVTDTDTSKEVNVEGYYMRINPYHQPASEVKNKIINLKNHEGEEGKMQLGELICVDALALVRFGLRAADDPKILNTIKVIDAKLKVDTPFGPCWHRYNNDGYGEDKQGNPYEGSGIGRAWPLLTGERGHYEVAAGNIGKAKELLKTMEMFSGNGLLPEQIWDTNDIPDKNLFFGRPSGSAMPLTWAHAEYIKLCFSIKEKKVFDMADYTYNRYVKNQQKSKHEIWRFDWPCKSILSTKILRIEVLSKAVVHWTYDNWQTKNETATTDSRFGMHAADIALSNKNAEEIKFTFFWKESNKWEDKDFTVQVDKNKDEAEKKDAQ